ncbi:hypothetical protein [Kitasatospora sp. NPDC056181]|uniref:scabin-related ADP-ribosyltransferase n=1 Tax=Kitasatospora sp. NPDC056181 TaxID=3345737 RepID=UPI0035DE955E
MHQVRMLRAGLGDPALMVAQFRLSAVLVPRWGDEDDKSAFVGASRGPSRIPDFRCQYEYEVDAPGGIDANATILDDPHHWEGGVASPGSIKIENIKSRQKFNPIDQTWGPPPVPNPYYRPAPGFSPEWRQPGYTSP